MRRMILFLLPLAVWSVGALPAQASTTAVDFSVDLAGAAPIADCTVTVSTGANGLAVLDAAVADGCIDSYDTATFPGFGEYVTCINDICEAVVTFWALYVDDEFATKGVSSLSFPSDGSAMGLSYEQWVVPVPAV